MSEVSLLRFGALEGRVLQLLWQFEEATPSDLLHLINDHRVTLPLIRCTLDKLHLKHMVRRRRVQKTYYYRSAADRATFLRLLSRQISEFLGEESTPLFSGDISAVRPEVLSGIGSPRYF